MTSSYADIFAIDPSFTRTGICARCDEGFKFHKIDIDGTFRKDFQTVYRRALAVSLHVNNLLWEYQPTRIIIETPPPTSQFSSGMWLLVASIITGIKNSQTYDHSLFLTPPQVARVLFKTKTWKKSDSVKIAKPFSQKGYRLSADEADAFIMMLPLTSDKLQRDCGVVRINYKYKELGREHCLNLASTDKMEVIKRSTKPLQL